MKTIRGNELSLEDRTAVLDAYIHNPSKPVKFRSSNEWLCSTTFLVRNDGRLDSRYRKTVSRPTYPNNPELWKVTR